MSQLNPAKKLAHVPKTIICSHCRKPINKVFYKVTRTFRIPFTEFIIQLKTWNENKPEFLCGCKKI